MRMTKMMRMASRALWSLSLPGRATMRIAKTGPPGQRRGLPHGSIRRPRATSKTTTGTVQARATSMTRWRRRKRRRLPIHPRRSTGGQRGWKNCLQAISTLIRMTTTKMSFILAASWEMIAVRNRTERMSFAYTTATAAATAAATPSAVAMKFPAISAAMRVAMKAVIKIAMVAVILRSAPTTITSSYTGAVMVTHSVSRVNPVHTMIVQTVNT